MDGAVGSAQKVVVALALATIASACTGIEPCGKPGITEACSCSGAAMGIRTCLPERVWDHCACGALPAPDAGGSGMSGGGMGGSGAISGGGGTSGTSGMNAPGGSGGSGGSAGAAPNADEDGGVEPIVDGGAGSSGTGGSAGMAGTGGTAGTTAPMSAAYKACTDATECGTGATCESATDPDDAFGTIRGCAPACAEASECPKPEGSYEAMLDCVDEHCRLECTPDLLQSPLSCPSGMRCASTGVVGPSYCF